MMDTDSEQNAVDFAESWDAYELDPTFVNSRREAIVIFISWFVAMCWAVPYCYFNGYNIADPADIPTTFGIPSWVVWGIGAPWIAADLFTTWFCFRFMQDDDLGVAGDEEPLEHNTGGAE